MDLEIIKNLINPSKALDKQYFLELLDGDKQRDYENKHIDAVLAMLKIKYLNKLRNKIKSAIQEKEELRTSKEQNAEKYRRALEINAEIASLKAKIEGYKCYFNEPYFARMDVEDDLEGYNSYYIGKHGDEGLEIVDWRAPLAKRYYQKSKLTFAINQYLYKVILRRALRTKNGKVVDFQNEYLSVKDYLTEDEIGGRDEAVIFDPYLKEILKSRKEKQEITDIIETIQEKQYEIITLPEDSEFAVQGVAGSGKTMILLHRLSYLMYNNELLKPENVLVITPSDSFNAFIDELSAILELDKVKTSTLNGYYLKLLSGVGIDLTPKINFDALLSPKYLQYIYSENFVKDVDKKINKIYDGVYGMFTGEDCREFIATVKSSCKEQESLFEYIKNASVRVRRCVLGEIKEKKEGGLYYTKPLRGLFNAVSDAREFLSLVEDDDRMKRHAYFYSQLLSFFKSIRLIRRSSDGICAQAIKDLQLLSVQIEREIDDLKRYKNSITGKEEYTYPERIERRRQTIKEIEATVCRVERIKTLFATTCDFADVLGGDSYYTAIGKCENLHDLALFFYRQILVPVKRRNGIDGKTITACDPFAICLILCKIGCNLSPKYAFLFVDEAQDLSQSEYYVLKTVNPNAKFNLFGDIQQNITAWRGIGGWETLGFKIYTLNRNYRNTNQIVNYVSKHLCVDMKPVGFDGEEVSRVSAKGVGKFLADKNGLRAIITSEQNLDKFTRKSYNILRQTGVISKSKINIMTVYESKGLEFTAVAVVDGDLTDNERYIAYTRALRDLAIVT